MYNYERQKKQGLIMVRVYREPYIGYQMYVFNRSFSRNKTYSIERKNTSRSGLNGDQEGDGGRKIEVI